MNEEKNCPICGEGHVTDHMDQVEAEYNAHKGNVPLHYQMCDACISDSAGAVQMRANKRGMVAFRNKLIGCFLVLKFWLYVSDMD
jgi:HTH-type transcriptional regulator/antitoxin MqsA